jgi:hypothetical protein
MVVKVLLMLLMVLVVLVLVVLLVLVVVVLVVACHRLCVCLCSAWAICRLRQLMLLMCRVVALVWQMLLHKVAGVVCGLAGASIPSMLVMFGS